MLVHLWKFHLIQLCLIQTLWRFHILMGLVIHLKLLILNINGGHQGVKHVKKIYHNDIGCPNRVRKVEKPVVDDDGFIEVNSKKGKGKQHVKNRLGDGVRLQKPKVTYQYRQVTKTNIGGASP